MDGVKRQLFHTCRIAGLIRLTVKTGTGKIIYKSTIREEKRILLNTTPSTAPCEIAARRVLSLREAMSVLAGWDEPHPHI